MPDVYGNRYVTVAHLFLAHSKKPLNTSNNPNSISDATSHHSNLSARTLSRNQENLSRSQSKLTTNAPPPPASPVAAAPLTSNVRTEFVQHLSESVAPHRSSSSQRRSSIRTTTDDVDGRRADDMNRAGDLSTPQSAHSKRQIRSAHSPGRMSASSHAAARSATSIRSSFAPIRRHADDDAAEEDDNDDDDVDEEEFQSATGTTCGDSSNNDFSTDELSASAAGIGAAGDSSGQSTPTRRRRQNVNGENAANTATGTTTTMFDTGAGGDSIELSAMWQNDDALRKDDDNGDERGESEQLDDEGRKAHSAHSQRSVSSALPDPDDRPLTGSGASGRYRDEEANEYSDSG